MILQRGVWSVDCINKVVLPRSNPNPPFPVCWLMLKLILTNSIGHITVHWLGLVHLVTRMASLQAPQPVCPDLGAGTANILFRVQRVMTGSNTSQAGWLAGWLVYCQFYLTNIPKY